MRQPPPSKSGQALLIVAWLGLASPAEDQLANTHRHRFLDPLRARRTLLLPASQGAAELSPDPFPHHRIIVDEGKKSLLRGEQSLG